MRVNRYRIMMAVFLWITVVLLVGHAPGSSRGGPPRPAIHYCIQNIGYWIQ